jgi:ABC-type polysaccharide/polyol phosphate transport system ATPase subunit
MASINIENLYVSGIDNLARSETLKEFVIKGLTRKIKKQVKIPILKGISLKVNEGDVLGVVGKNGSGKSSLLKAIAGIYSEEKGKVVTEGTITPVIEMGLGFSPEMSGYDNIKLGFVYSGRIDKHNEKVVQRIIDFSELEEKIDIPLKYYSSGMVARLAFAVSCMQDSDILLLDEVFATGDEQFRTKSYNYMKKKIRNTAITIMVNHNRDEILNICNRCIMMEDGKIVIDGTPAEVFNCYN